MNICFFARFPIEPNKGGVQRITHILGDEFRKLGHQVFFLCLHTNKPVNKSNYQFYLPEKKVNAKENKKEIADFVAQKGIDIFINQASVYSDVIDLVKEVKPKGAKLITVHNNCVECLHKLYREIVMSNRRKSLLWQCVDKLPVWSLLTFLSKTKYKMLFNNAMSISDCFVLYFESFKKELETLTNKELDIATIPNPASFEVNEQCVQSKEKRIVYVGRVVQTQKRVDRLMRIWHKLHDQYLDYEFDLVGDGEYLEDAKRYAEKYELSRIHFHGTQDPKPYLERAQIFTMTSDFEGYGMVLIEAQAYGAIPVAFRCFSSIDEVINNNQSGIIIDDFKEEEYILNVEKLINNKALRLSMIKNGFDQVHNFDRRKIVSLWANLFNNLI